MTFLLKGNTTTIPPCCCQFSMVNRVNKVKGRKNPLRGNDLRRAFVPRIPVFMSLRSRYRVPQIPVSCPSDPGIVSLRSRYFCPSDPGSSSLESRYSCPPNPGISVPQIPVSSGHGAQPVRSARIGRVVPQIPVLAPGRWGPICPLDPGIPGAVGRRDSSPGARYRGRRGGRPRDLSLRSRYWTRPDALRGAARQRSRRGRR